MWTAPIGKLFFGVTNDLVSFSHMSGLLVRHDSRWPWWFPTAEVPIIAASSMLMTDGGVSWLRC